MAVSESEQRPESDLKSKIQEATNIIPHSHLAQRLSSAIGNRHPRTLRLEHPKRALQDRKPYILEIQSFQIET